MKKAEMVGLQRETAYLLEKLQIEGGKRKKQYFR
jgi:hypothetical protein